MGPPAQKTEEVDGGEIPVCMARGYWGKGARYCLPKAGREARQEECMLQGEGEGKVVRVWGWGQGAMGAGTTGCMQWAKKQIRV